MKVYNNVDYGSFSLQSDTESLDLSSLDIARLFFFYSSKVNTSIVQEFDCLTLV